MWRMSEASAAPIDVTVAVPIYNAARYLRPCLDSLLRLNYPPGSLEILCVDNGSTDGSLAILNEFDGRIRILHESKRGAAAARNTAMRAARGTLIAFTDADCVIDPDWLTHLLPPVRTGEADVCGGRILALPGAGTIERFGELIHDHCAAIEACHPPAFISMNIAARVDLLLSHGGFDERWIRSQDSELAFRLAAAGRRFVYRSQAVIFHHNRSTLKQLCKEAYTHGYYGAELFRVYRDFIDRYPRPAPGTPRILTDRPPALQSIPAWQRALLWQLFRTWKRAGWAAGRRRPPECLRPQPGLPSA